MKTRPISNCAVPVLAAALAAGALLLVGCGDLLSSDSGDTTPPAAPVINSPVNGSIVNTATPTLSGISEPGSTVIVFIDGVSNGTAPADVAGNWSYTTTTLSEGVRNFTATATDAAGNISATSAVVTVTVSLGGGGASSLFDYGPESLTFYDVSGSVATQSGQLKYYYDAQKRLTLFEYYNWSGANWDLEIEEDFTYAANGRFATYTRTEYPSADRERYIYSYDGAGRVSSETTQQYNNVTTMWDPAYLYTYTYDSAGRIVQELAQTYDPVLAAFEDSSRFIHTYDAAGRIASKLEEYTFDGGIAWNFGWQEDFTYDAFGRLAQVLDIGWSGDPDHRHTYFYQSSTDLIDRVEHFDWDSVTMSLQLSDTEYLSFDLNNRLISTSTISATTLTEIERGDYINTNAGSSYSLEQFPMAFKIWILLLYGRGAPVTGYY